MDTFKFDTILSSLHDLQQAKSVNEVKLEEERSNRKQLESKVSKAAADFRSISAKHSSLMETEQVTEQKTLQLEKQIQHLEILNREKSGTIERLNEKIMTEQQLQQNNLQEFESLITELTDKFRTAPKIFTDENQDSNIAECKDDIRELKCAVSEMENKLKGLSESTAVVSEEAAPLELDEHTMQLVFDMLTVEHKASEERRKALEEKERKLTEQSIKLDNEVRTLEQDLLEL